MIQSNVIRFLLLLVCVTQSAIALEVGDSAPCVVLDQVAANGSTVSGCIRDATQNSQTFTIIDFFSIQCETCLTNLPAANDLAYEVSTTAAFRYVSVDRKEADVRAFVKSHQENFNVPAAFDVKQRAMAAYGVTSTPTMFVLKHTGAGTYSIVYKHGGLLTPEVVNEIKRSLIED